MATSVWLSSLYMLVLGAGLGASLQVLVVAVQNAVSYADLGAATGGSTFFRSIGGSFGAATFGAVFSNVLAGDLATALHGLALPHGVTAASGASPAQLAHLPAAVHAGYVSGYATALQTVFLVAVPFGVLAFALSWTLKDVPLRTSTGAQDPADTLAPTSRPTIRTSDQEMERALTALLSRERRRDVYARLTDGQRQDATAGRLAAAAGRRAPRVARHELAEHLYMTDTDLERRLGELVAAGYARRWPTARPSRCRSPRPAKHAFDELFRARHDAIARLAAGWDPEQHPRLVELLSGSPISSPPAARRPDVIWSQPPRPAARDWSLAEPLQLWPVSISLLLVVRKLQVYEPVERCSRSSPGVWAIRRSLPGACLERNE